MESIADLIRQSFPEISAGRIEALPHPGWGGDSDVWLVDGRWIFRVPRTAEVAARLAREVCLLPQLAARLPLSIPRFTHVARNENASVRFVGYEAIPGEPLRGEVLRLVPRTTLDRAARDLGTFLRALHRTPLGVALACGLALPLRSARETVEDRFQTARDLVFPHLGRGERAWLGDRFEAFLADPRHFTYEPVLCHGDLSSDHLFFDVARGESTGVIDFGDLAIGDPAGDFTWRAEYGEAFFESVLRVYSIADASFAERVAFRVDCLPLYQIVYGVETGHAGEIDEGVIALRQSSERSATGR